MYRKFQSKDPLLDSLIEKYGSDKNLSEYNLIYAEIFQKIRFDVKSVLEIGIGSMISPHSRFDGIKTHYPHYSPGGSLRVWRDYFPNAFVHGVDIGEDCLIEEERIKTFIFSSTLHYKCLENLFNYKYDIIIDDGDHLGLSQLLTFKNLAPLLKENGYYIIEDVGGGGGYPVTDGSHYNPNLLIEFKDEFYKTAEKHQLTVYANKRPLVLSRNHVE
jgi:hypothetical protein